LHQTLVVGAGEPFDDGRGSVRANAFHRLQLLGTGLSQGVQRAKGIDQLMDEGVAQLFTGKHTGRKIIGTVGALQFEVIQYRLEHEYSAKCRYEPITLHKTAWFVSKNKSQLEDFRARKANYIAFDKEGREVFLADSPFALQMAQEKYTDIKFFFTSEFEG